MKLRNSGNIVYAAQVTVHLNHLQVHIASTLQCLYHPLQCSPAHTYVCTYADSFTRTLIRQFKSAVKFHQTGSRWLPLIASKVLRAIQIRPLHARCTLMRHGNRGASERVCVRATIRAAIMARIQPEKSITSLQSAA